MPLPDLNLINNANLSGLAQPVQVIAVTGGKGGVGKTSVSVNLATALAASGKRALISTDKAPPRLAASSTLVSTQQAGFAGA